MNLFHEPLLFFRRDEIKDLAAEGAKRRREGREENHTEPLPSASIPIETFQEIYYECDNALLEKMRGD